MPKSLDPTILSRRHALLLGASVAGDEVGKGFVLAADYDRNALRLCGRQLCRTLTVDRREKSIERRRLPSEA